MSNLIVSFDPGASLTKIVYELATEGKPCLMTMEPEMLKLPQSSIDAYMSSRKGLESPKPVDEAWVSSPANGDTQCTVVGFLARQFSASARLDKLKYETSIHKALAVIGAIAQHNKLPNRFSLSLTSLLPYGEYQNRQAFEQQLQSALKDFRFRGQRLRVKLERFECLPEGAGLAMIRQRQNGKEWFNAQTIAVLMFGHRNTSLLLFERGKMTAGYTNGLGFHQMVKRVIERTSGQDATVLTSAIYAAGSDITTDNQAIRTLVKSREPKNLDYELQMIVNAIATAKAEYWSRLYDWLESTLPAVNEVILSGGAALYLEQELQDCFQEISTYWGADLQQQVQEVFKDKSNDYCHTFREQEALSFRLIDAFGLFMRFRAQIEKVA
ncbi:MULTISPECIES: ParM/StbA family protein [Calothrix]|uniref:ParM/StbA family protein n=2 Tax=Calothrix TaxID=1186 RepID=A0ABR8AHT5_9CYAN|nr:MULTISPECIES: ParM/StbA family protein [Calothrix]MBD2199486.1 ParM/StbA family protein [Calothrix parietina FACHB-288]MBD2228134.1 ParM/StbA family protein [Calothrix anomala FACHB-343]